MRTTVDLPDALFRRAKAEAALRGRLFKDLIEEGLRLVLAEDAPPVESLAPAVALSAAPPPAPPPTPTRVAAAPAVNAEDECCGFLDDPLPADILRR